MCHNNILFQNGTEQEECRLVFRCAVWMSSGLQHSNINDSNDFTQPLQADDGQYYFEIGRDSFQILV